MGIGCDDSGLQLIQILEITANIDCQQVWKGKLGPLSVSFDMQGGSSKDLEMNIDSYYKFDSNNLMTIILMR